MARRKTTKRRTASRKRKSKRLTPQQKKFKKASKECQTETKKKILSDPRKSLFKTYGACMRRILKK